jgi:hypothetical protein
MPIQTACPKCERDYALADTLKGKYVKCKDCAHVFLVEPVAPRTQVPAKTRPAAATTTAPQPPAPRKKTPRPAEDEDVIDVVAAEDDDLDDEERQARRARRSANEPESPKKPGGMMIWLIGGGALAAVLLLGCGVVAIAGYWYFGRPDNSAANLANNSFPNLDNTKIGGPGDDGKGAGDGGGKGPIPVPGRFHVPAVKEEVVLSAPAADVVVGGGGRFLVLHLPTANKLAIFDGWSGKVVKELVLAENTTLFAANQSQLVVLYPASKTIAFYSLATFEKERTESYPGQMRNDDIREVCMGSASNGPLFVYHPKEKQTYAVDLKTLTPTAVKWTHWAPNNAYGPLNMRASPDGNVLVGWSGGWAGAEVATFQNGIQTGPTPNTPNIPFSLGLFALPNASGKLLFTPGGGVAPIGGSAPSDPALKDAYMVPAEEPGYFLALRSGRELPWGFPDNEPLPTPNDVTVYNEDRKLLFSLRGCDELLPGTNLHWEKRVHFYPSQGLLISVNGAKDRLVLRRIDMNAKF